MFPNNIVIGQKYKNLSHPGAIYLGAGRPDKDKFLVILQDPPDTTPKVGWTVTYDEENIFSLQFWSQFRPL